MLSKRTNILFDHTLWNQMSSLAKKQNISIGEYMQVGLLLKILETLNDIKRNMDGEK